MSKYDDIKTAADLVAYVRNHGFSTQQEDICRAQDIFGRSTVEELVELANNIGRKNSGGEPDPKGSWSGGVPTRDVFYSIAFQIWNWEDAVRFWNLHSNPQTEELEELREANRKLNEDLTVSTVQKNKEHESRIAETKEKLEAKEKAERLAAELHDKEMEIMELKAKLYDLMMAGKEEK